MVKKEEMLGLERVLVTRVDLRLLRWLGHVERIDKCCSL